MPYDLALAFTWILHGVAVLVCLGVFLLSLSGRYRSKLRARFSQTIELPIANDTIAAAAERRILRRNGAISLGGVVGILGSAVSVLVNPPSTPMLTMWLVTIPLFFIGGATGGVAVALRESLFRRDPDAVRVARPTAVTIHDYVSPRRLRTPPLLAALACALYLVGLALGWTGLIDGSVFIRSAALPAVIVVLLLTGTGVLLTRLVLRRPQPAGSELELAWDDAFRADTFRSMWMFGTIVAWSAAATVGLGILQALDAITEATWADGLGMQSFNWGLLAALVVFGFGGAQTYFRFRLWPDLQFEHAVADSQGMSLP